MKFDRSNKFELCYFWQVNSLRLKSSVASKWTSKYLLGYVTFILLGMVHHFTHQQVNNHTNVLFKGIQVSHTNVFYIIIMNVWLFEWKDSSSTQIYIYIYIYIYNLYVYIKYKAQNRL